MRARSGELKDDSESKPMVGLGGRFIDHVRGGGRVGIGAGAESARIRAMGMQLSRDGRAVGEWCCCWRDVARSLFRSWFAPGSIWNRSWYPWFSVLGCSRLDIGLLGVGMDTRRQCCGWWQHLCPLTAIRWFLARCLQMKLCHEQTEVSALPAPALKDVRCR